MHWRWEHFHVQAAKRIYQLTDKNTRTLYASMSKMLSRMNKLDFLFRRVSRSPSHN